MLKVFKGKEIIEVCFGIDFLGKFFFRDNDKHVGK